MAEIKVQHKERRGSRWPWLLLLVLPLLFFLFRGRNDDREAQSTGDVSRDTSAYVAPGPSGAAGTGGSAGTTGTTGTGTTGTTPQTNY